MSKTYLPGHSSSILLFFYLSCVLAVNDWAKPCFNGTCSYDLSDDISGSFSTLTIWGSNTSIADITTAGGWEIINCHPDKLEQDIRIVCKGIDIDGDGDNDGCSHLFAEGLRSSSDGNVTNATSRLGPTGDAALDVGKDSMSTDEDKRAIGKIVRLPEECGKQAFARIASTWTHENQTVPSHISKRLAPLHRRIQKFHQVKGLTIDTQFHKSDSAQHGTVNFAIVSASVSGAKPSSNSAIPLLKSSGHSGKSYFVNSRVHSGAGAVGSGIHGISDGVGAVGNAITATKSINISDSAPFNIGKALTLFNRSIECANGSMINPTISANKQMKVDVEGGIKGAVNLGVAASGSLTDLRVDGIELTTTLNADFNGSLLLPADSGGSKDKFFQAVLNLPGAHEYPGIWSMQYSFYINGQAKIPSNIHTDRRIGMVYHFNDLEFNFPNGGGQKSGACNAGDTPLQLSVQPSANATGKVEVHLIPSLNLGISAFGEVNKARVLTNLNASASTIWTGNVVLPRVQANITLRDEKPSVEVREPVIRGRGAVGAYYLNKRSPAPEGY